MLHRLQSGFYEFSVDWRKGHDRKAIEKPNDKYNFYIVIESEYIEVSEGVYKEYYRMERRERYLAERDRKNGVMSYHALDKEKMMGEEL